MSLTVEKLFIIKLDVLYIQVREKPVWERKECVCVCYIFIEMSECFLNIHLKTVRLPRSGKEQSYKVILAM